MAHRLNLTNDPDPTHRRLIRLTLLPEASTESVQKRGSWLRWIAPIMTLCLVVVWQIVVPAEGPTSLLLPRPSQIAQRFLEVAGNGLLTRELLTTSVEIAAGLLIGAGTAFLFGYLIAHSRTLEQIAWPYIVAFQALPIVAIAPALILWLGPGLFSNILLCAFIVFFPMLVSTIVGIKNVPEEAHELMRSFAATRWETFRRLELPAALPVLFGGLKVSATLAVAGAVVAESVTPLGGIGSLLYAARSRYDSPLAFVSVFTLTIFALLLYGAVGRLERRLLVWQRDSQGSF